MVVVCISDISITLVHGPEQFAGKARLSWLTPHTNCYVAMSAKGILWSFKTSGIFFTQPTDTLIVLLSSQYLTTVFSGL